MHASPFRRLSAHARPTALAVVVALVLGVLAAAGPDHRAQALDITLSLFKSTDVPDQPAEDDPMPVELGMKFTSLVAGKVTGVRFYKGSQNTGQHTGSLWTASGRRLATVRFANETAGGWQQASFPTPVKIEANTPYVISYYAPNGHYAADEGFWGKELRSPMLTGLANGTNGANGVYRYGRGGGFPRSSYRATNYYVDVMFGLLGSDDTKPTVTAQSPAAGALDVSATPTVSATFSEPVDPTSIVTTVTPAGSSTLVSTTRTYDASSQTLSLRPSAALLPATSYTVTISGARDLSILRNQMLPVTWTFTTAAAAPAPDPNGCPCTILGDTPPTIPSAPDDSAVTLGVRFRSSVDGYVTGLRFYKGGSANGGRHTGTLWDNAGGPLATVEFTGESESGWQTATFSGPVRIAKNTTYVASYYAPAGHYAVTYDAFAGAPIGNGPLTALASGVDGKNGVYAVGPKFPDSEYRQTNYFVDVVFATTAIDKLAPTVTSTVPAAGSTGAAASTAVAASFSEPVTDAAVALNPSSGGSAVAGTLSYDNTRWQAKLVPSRPLSYSTQYTATVAGAKDAAGNVMAPLSWTFTTAAEPAGPPDVGPGGPIAVVTSGANPYSKYYAEMLKTEGLNEFATIDVSTLSATTLAGYDTVLLAEVPVSTDQASVLSTWVGGGGNLIAMKPSASLAGLLGLTTTGKSFDNGYLKVDPATRPGAGIVSETMQYHATADRYTLKNAGDTKTVAALYSDATTALGNPAVTLRTVGTAGGEAAAFTYDLAKSVALTRQGNLAWAGTERDNAHYGSDPNVVRSDDMFFGGSTAKDWIDLSKVAIPQADEQQRLLANLIQTMNRDKKPLPRFWYFPNSAKAVIVATGDDHANNGTAGRFDQWLKNSPPDCSVKNWTCLRYSSYLWNGTPLSDAAAAAYSAQGFEVGLHASIGPANYTSSSIFGIYADQMARFKSSYPSLPNPRSTRFHAIVFSDWASQPKAEIANGMNMDTNYYYWPDTWIRNRPGFMTGSGMAMRFTDTDGSMIDNYQAATQMTDESGQDYPYTVDTLLDNALDPAKGYYGSFVANMHTDQATEVGSDALISSAKAHGNVPIVSAKQLTDWLDGRNASRYSNVAWNATARTLTFSVTVGGGADNLVSMIPTAGPGGSTLSGITRDGSTVAFTTSTVKGLEYASFKPTSAGYTVSYGGSSSSMLAAQSAGSTTKQVAGRLATTADRNTGAVQNAPETPTTDQTAVLDWTTTRPASTEVLLGTSPSTLAPAVTKADTTTEHRALLAGLKPATTYYYRLVSTDLAGRSVVTPARDAAPARLATRAPDRTAPAASEATITPAGDNAEVTWTTNEPSATVVRITAPGAAAQEYQISSRLTTNHTFTLTDLQPDSTYQVAVGTRDAAGNAALGKTSRVVTASPGAGQTTDPTFTLGDATGAAAVSDDGNGALSLTGPTSDDRTGTFTSDLLDARAMVDWDRASFAVDLPDGARAGLEVRTGSTSDQAAGWTEWTPVRADQGWRVPAASRYLQYRVTLAAPAGSDPPTVASVSFSSNAEPIIDPGETEGG